MIQIAAYRGKSGISRIIRLLTYSQYSHIAILFTARVELNVNGRQHRIEAGSVIEAWKGGVRLSASLSAAHTPGTPVDLFSFKEPISDYEQTHLLAGFLWSQLGKKYDYLNVARFVPLVRLLLPRPVPTIWTRSHVFCSELAMEACAVAGRDLLERCAAWEVPPRDPPRSPLLSFDKTLITT